MSIADRLGLVIHWISFITGVILSAICIFGIFYSLLYMRTPDNGLRYDFLFDITRLSITTFFIPLLLGWLIRYILSGKVHILPFK